MTKNKKRLFLIASLLIGLLLLFSFIFYIFYSQQKKTEVIGLIQNKQINKTESKIELQSDLDNFKKAQENNNLDDCLVISNNLSKDFCVQEIAVKTKASSSCLLISDQNSQTNCLATILLNLAIVDKNLAACQEIQQSMLAKTCVEKIVESDTNADCNLIKDQVLKDSCWSVIYYQKAKDTKDSKFCEQISELIRKANCLSELKNIDLHSDADKDGLDFLQEIANNTDPNNPDSDNDGYKDGDEFKNGFNPDGPGALALVQSPSVIACKDIKDAVIRSICFSELKNQLLDISKCSEIKDEKLKEYCANILTPNKPPKPKSVFDQIQVLK